MKIILTVLGGTDQDQRNLEVAENIATAFDGHVGALHVRREPSDSIPVAGEGMSAELFDQIMHAAEEESEIRARAAHATFDAWRQKGEIRLATTPAPQVGISASLSEETGRIGAIVARYGSTADLIVTGRPSGDVDEDAADALTSAIFDTGRAVLLAPRETVASVGRKPMIFWNGSAQAARAVAAARELLVQSDSVEIVTINEGDAVDTGLNLSIYLAWHGITASVTRLESGRSAVGEALLAEAANKSADLLIMGAYTHSRLRQLILGGVTKHVLANATLPVWVAH